MAGWVCVSIVRCCQRAVLSSFDPFEGRSRREDGNRQRAPDTLWRRFSCPGLWFGTLPQDDEYHRGYDHVMLAALPVHFGRDIIEECQQSANRSRAAAEWLSFYFRNVKLTSTGMEVQLPERPGWWVTIDDGVERRIASGEIRFSRKAKFQGSLRGFRFPSYQWTVGILSSLNPCTGMDCLRADRRLLRSPARGRSLT